MRKALVTGRDSVTLWLGTSDFGLAVDIQVDEVFECNLFSDKARVHSDD